MKEIHCKFTARGASIALPAIMGIVNITPDSFVACSRAAGDAAVRRAVTLAKDGAAIIDIGACSTRPHAPHVSEAEELARVRSVLPQIVHEIGKKALLSIDTYRPSVARYALELGVHIINEGYSDSYNAQFQLFDLAARSGAGYVFTHGCSRMPTENCPVSVPNVAATVREAFERFLEYALQSGGLDSILLDPGFGIGKNIETNYELLRDFAALNIGLPLLAGVSRKSMTHKPYGLASEEALLPSKYLEMHLFCAGASIVRTHDVRELTIGLQIAKKIGLDMVNYGGINGNYSSA